ncbi:MAG: hypothetical protein N838_05620 [Thiohalocapsa sp. PB-PSB1]|nr:MAG: hypothetical protein N838_05620 [Thiohalocapsa sp. PB-PSB1]
MRQIKTRLLAPGLVFLFISASVLAEPPRINDWVPLVWWSPVQFASGLLNDDSLEDLAVVLERKYDAPEDPAFERGSLALLVLFRTEAENETDEETKTWRRGYLIPGMLPCVSCSGKLSHGRESALFDLSISADGILEIGWIQKREAIKAVRLYITWHAEQQGLVLLSDDVVQIKPGTSEQTRLRRHYLNGTQWIDGELRNIPPRVIPIEDLSAEQY